MLKSSRFSSRLLLFPLLVVVLVSVYHLNTSAVYPVLDQRPTAPLGPRPDLRPPTTHDPPKYKPAPTNTPTPVSDPFPLLAYSDATPPPIPSHNVPRKNMHREYGLEKQPPLFIGFTRQWPVLLQCIVSYITAGWPASSIYVIENTGVQYANKQGLLTIQNPFYLNYTTLERLGVNVIRTPTLLTFAQLQNFFLHTAHVEEFPYYFYSHQDVMVFSWEEGYDHTERPGDHALDYYDDDDRADIESAVPAGEPEYRTIYENALRELRLASERDERWGVRWFQYDHLTLINRAALDAISGWDALIPYYMTDCDFNARLRMDGWSAYQRRIGIINDVSTTLTDLAALYRESDTEIKFVDLHPLSEEEQMSWFREPTTIKTQTSDTYTSMQTQTATYTQDAAYSTNTASNNSPYGTEDGSLGGSVGAPHDIPPDAVPTSSSHETSQPGWDSELFQDDQRPADTSDVNAVGGDIVDGASWETRNPLAEREAAITYFAALVSTGNDMGSFKWRDVSKTRNQWQTVQQGGFGEPYYYDPQGFAFAFDQLTAAGREIYRFKWGHEGCELVGDTALSLADQWRVQPDWRKKGIFG